MRKLSAFVCAAAAFMAGCRDYSADTAHVSGIIDGQPLQLSSHMQHKLAEESVRLLKSCTYANLHPTGEYASRVAHAQEQSYLHFTFSEPRVVALSVRKREVASGKVDVELREMVITLPLESGAILVRSNQATFYFAKFDCPLSKELEKTLKKAQK